jgi:hypothetical protein
MHRLVDPDLMRQLMKRTGDGAPVTIRDLAKACSAPHGTIGNLLTGSQKAVPAGTALAIANRLGVDLLVLFTPTGRTVPAHGHPLVEELSAA